MLLAGISRHEWLAMAFIVLAVILGGGGSPAPQAELLLQVVTCLLLLLWLWLPSSDDKGAVPRPHDRLIWILSGLTLALPLLQLVPLPPSWWQSLPGQDGRIAALSLIGRGDSWQPLSQSPARTLAGLLSLAPPLFAGFAVAALAPAGRQRVLLALAAVVLCSAVLGAAQISLGDDALRLYAQSHRGYIVGFQANRNAQADILLIGAVAVAALIVPMLAAAGSRRRRDRAAARISRQSWWLIMAGLVLLLLLGVVLTGSRMGIALIALAGLTLWLIARPVLGGVRSRRMAGVIAAGAGVLLICGYLLLQGNTMLQRSAQRFDATGDPRGDLWQDTLFAIDAAWPVGVGLGGFQPAMLAAERLEVLDGTRPNRAHNDYLEFLLEGGLPAAVIGLAAIGVLGLLAVRALRRRPSDRAQILCGCAVLLIIALHSFVDYPLRSMALACMFGVGTGLLAAPPRSAAASFPGRTVKAGAELAA